MLPLGLVSKQIERAVVEHVAVLIDLDERRASCAAACRRTPIRCLRSLSMRARDECRLRAERQRDRVEGLIDRPNGRRLRHLPDLRGRRILALRQTVDLVVEQQDLEVDVAAERVDEVVAADRQRVPVAGHDPDVELRLRGREPGRDRGRAPVDAVEAVGVHVIREPAAAADARDEHQCFPAPRRARA